VTAWPARQRCDVSGATRRAPLSGSSTHPDAVYPIRRLSGGGCDTQDVRDWLPFKPARLLRLPKGDVAWGWTICPLRKFRHRHPADTTDRSATLMSRKLPTSPPWCDPSGPGIKTVKPAPVAAGLGAAFQANATLVSHWAGLHFTCADGLAALPRTTGFRLSMLQSKGGRTRHRPMPMRGWPEETAAVTGCGGTGRRIRSANR